MNTLFRFIVRYQFFLLFIVLEVLSFWLLAKNTYYQQSKVEGVARNISGYVSKNVHAVSSYFALRQTNNALAKENLQMRRQLALLSTKAEALSNKVGDTIVSSEYSFIPAKVINNSVSKQYNYLTLNVGSKHGVTEEMGVITNDGVVGIVVGVSYHYSRVISLLNIDLKISAKFKSSNYFGSLYWEGKNYRQVTLGDIPHHAIIAVGDTIVTSGFSAIFPPDINLGTVSSFETKGSNFYTVRVKLFNDFKQLHHVWVVQNLWDKERDLVEDIK
jgi:rod shape-determining protein MreC